MPAPQRGTSRTSVAWLTVAARVATSFAAIVALSGANRAMAQTLPPGWVQQDIGPVTLAGSATYSAGVFTVQGAGADIWGTSDSFAFVNQPLSGDGQVVAHVRSMGNTNPYAKAGVMIRETLTAGSAHVVLDLKPGGGIEFMTRAATGGTTSYIAGGTGTWLKLVRSSGVFTAYVSTDGSAWTPVGSRSVTMGANVWVGLVVCSHNTGALNTSTFDNVTVGTVTGGGTDAPPVGSLPAGWSRQDIGSVGIAGDAGYSNGSFTVKGAGADIWGTADSFHFANQALAGDGEIVARVASMGNTNPYAKAGVMVRETLTASSPHVILDMKPGGSVEFMARSATGGSTSYIAGGTGNWLKLVRSNGIFTASVSANGTAWTVIGSRAISMGANVWVGLAVCSHNTGALNTSVFDNVAIGPLPGGTDPPPAAGPLPDGWTSEDLGPVGIAGSASFSNGTFTLKGAGADIWGSADAFHFASRPLGGAGEIVAHVVSMTNTHAYAKAGVMIRDSTSASSPHVTLDVKPNGTVEFLARGVQGGPTAYIGGGTGSWVKLVRSGNNGFTGYVSTDGATWQLIGSTIVTMSSATVRMGLAVCSHNVGALNTAVFDNVTATGTTTAPDAPVITSPPSGSTFPVGSLPVVMATASENVRIDLYANDGTTNAFAGTFRPAAGGRPPTFIWFLPQPGTYTVTAVAQYSNAPWGTSSPITIHISDTAGANVPPTVTITNPLNNALVPAGSPVTITATATDPDSGIARVDYWIHENVYIFPGYYYGIMSEYYLGGATASPYAVTWTTPGAAAGATVWAVVTDTSGLATASWVQVGVQ